MSLVLSPNHLLLFLFLFFFWFGKYYSPNQLHMGILVKVSESNKLLLWHGWLPISFWSQLGLFNLYLLYRYSQPSLFLLVTCAISLSELTFAVTILHQDILTLPSADEIHRNAFFLYIRKTGNFVFAHITRLKPSCHDKSTLTLPVIFYLPPKLTHLKTIFISPLLQTHQSSLLLSSKFDSKILLPPKLVFTC